MAQNEPKHKSRAQQAVDLVRAGTHSKADAARALGVNKSTVSVACRAAGIVGITEIGRRALSTNISPETARARNDALARHRRKVRAENISLARPGDDIETLHFVRGLSYGDIAELLGLSRNAVAGKIDRIKRSQTRKRQAQCFRQEAGQ